MVLSPDADTMYLWSKSTTFTAARWPTKTLLRLISDGDCISHTAIERSCNTTDHLSTKLDFSLDFHCPNKLAQ